MRENPVKSALTQGRAVVGVSLNVAPYPVLVRVMANAGYDFVFLDLEHNFVAPNTLLDSVQMARACNISPFVRTGDVEYHLIANTLDSGADGLIVPRVETRAQVERLVSYAKFPPHGARGCGTIAPLDFRREDWGAALPWVNSQTMIVPMIESHEGIDALEDMLGVPGVDAILVGPLDLSIRLGLPGKLNAPEVHAAVDRVVQICRRHNVPSGILARTPEALRTWWDKGMRFLVCDTLLDMVMRTATQNVQAVRAYAGPR